MPNATEQAHGWRHQRAAADEIPGIVQLVPSSGEPTSDPTTPARGDLLVGVAEPPGFSLLNVGAAGSVLWSDGTDPQWTINPRIAGYARVGSATAPSNTTAGDLTAVRGLFGDDAALTDNARLQLNVASHVPATSATHYSEVHLIVAPDGSSASERDAFNINYYVRPTASDGGLHIAYRVHLQHDSGAFNLTHTSNALLGNTVVVDQNVLGSNVVYMGAFRSNLRLLSGTADTVIGYDSQGTCSGTSSVTDWMHIRLSAINATAAITTLTGLHVENLGETDVGTAIAIDIAAQVNSPTANIGIRNASNLRQTQYATFLGASAPSNTTDGDVTVRRLRVVGTGGSDGAFLTDNAVRLSGQMTSTSGVVTGITQAFTIAPTSNSTAQHWSVIAENFVIPSAGVTLSTVGGIQFAITHRQDSTLSGATTAIFLPVNLDSSSGTIGTITTATAVQARPYARFAGTGTVTVTTMIGLHVLNPTQAGLTTTTLYGIYISNATASTITNQIGIHIEALTQGGTLNVGIRNTSNQRQTGYLSLLGATTAPTNTTSGDLSAVRGIFGTDASLASGPIVMVNQGTLGNEVFRLQSVATNDDPSERVYQNRAATTDATVTTLHTVTIPATTTVQIVAFVQARRTGGTAGTAEDGASYIVVATVKNVAGTATLIGAVSQLTVHEDQAAWDATIDVTGATARVRVTGALDNNVTWHTTVRVLQVGS